MRIVVLSTMTACTLIFLGAMHPGARAAAPDLIMIRSGETVDLGPLFWVTNCRSTLKATPMVEVMEGPAELTVSVKNQKVMPRKFECAKPVEGGELSLTAAKDIKTQSEGKLFLRIKYPTKDGERQNGREIDYTLFPATPAPPSGQDVK